MRVERLVAEGDWVSALWVFRGTHTAAGYAGLPPTGTPVEMKGITIWRIVDGKIQDEWTSFDELNAYGQVVLHVQAQLWIVLVALLAIFIAIERLVWAGVRRFVTRLRHKTSQV